MSIGLRGGDRRRASVIVVSIASGSGSLIRAGLAEDFDDWRRFAITAA